MWGPRYRSTEREGKSVTKAESRTCYEERGTEEGICDGVKEGEGVNVLCMSPSLISPPHLLCREGQEEAPVQVSQHTQEVKKEGEVEREVSRWSLQLCGLSGTFSLPLLPHFPCLLPPLSSSPPSLFSLPPLPPSLPSLSSLPLLPPFLQVTQQRGEEGCEGQEAEVSCLVAMVIVSVTGSLGHRSRSAERKRSRRERR